RAVSALGAAWETVELPPDAVTAKRGAVRAHASQQALAADFLSAFVRRNELLSRWPEVDAGAAPALLPDSVRDRWGRALCGAADFTALEVEAGDDAVLLRARLREPAAGWPVYHLYWKPLHGPAARLTTRVYRIIGARCSPPGARFTLQGSAFEISIPRSELGDTPAIMVAADAWGGPLLLDRTPWRVVRVGGSTTVTRLPPSIDRSVHYRHRSPMEPETLQISLPEALRRHVEERVRGGEYSSPSEFIRELVRKDLDEHRRHRREVLERELLGAAESLERGEGRDVTPAYWHELRLRARDRLIQEQAE
ncbi:MAG TPA: ribbon-helix-helix domain-containing protein, partial [Armatimonadota bacterium]|nr:ribbon-helix-helix domain-containing protein [Armatimonadota bacterium]